MPGDCRAFDSCLMLDYVCVINCLIIIIIITIKIYALRLIGLIMFLTFDF